MRRKNGLLAHSHELDKSGYSKIACLFHIEGPTSFLE